MVFPKWVTQVGVMFSTIGVAVEGLRAAIDMNILPVWLNLGLIAVGTIASAGGVALGDADGDGTPNLIDPDWRK